MASEQDTRELSCTVQDDTTVTKPPGAVVKLKGSTPYFSKNVETKLFSSKDLTEWRGSERSLNIDT
jgi:hypothetical protein